MRTAARFFIPASEVLNSTGILYRGGKKTQGKYGNGSMKAVSDKLKGESERLKVIVYPRMNANRHECGKNMPQRHREKNCVTAMPRFKIYCSAVEAVYEILSNEYAGDTRCISGF
ncbi:MAG: hypothetical protein A2014_05565 [Spirochaetes bacterium GWF1_49_6]|nr:MAG: hypothetical protein A2014_05565 [Spirochaetes bacterium GWF1_49_6]